MGILCGIIVVFVVVIVAAVVAVVVVIVDSVVVAIDGCGASLKSWYGDTSGVGVVVDFS